MGNERVIRHVDRLVERYPALEAVYQEIIDAYVLMEECYTGVGGVKFWWLGTAAPRRTASTLAES